MAEEVVKTIGRTIVMTTGVVIFGKIYGTVKYLKGYYHGYQKAKSEFETNDGTDDFEEGTWREV